MDERWQLRSERRPGSIDELLEILLENRGMAWGQLRPDIRDLEAYAVFKGIEEAAETVTRHVRSGNKIVLVSDYDCDGVTSLAQASCFFKDIGYSRFDTFIPLRSEGYGMPRRAVEAHPDASLFLVFDCGTRDVEAISLARSRGIDTVVIDHHEVSSPGTAPAGVLVNPKQPDCPSMFKEFSASGLTLLFLQWLSSCETGRPISPVGGLGNHRGYGAAGGRKPDPGTSRTGLPQCRCLTADAPLDRSGQTAQQDTDRIPPRSPSGTSDQRRRTSGACRPGLRVAHLSE